MAKVHDGYTRLITKLGIFAPNGVSLIEVTPNQIIKGWRGLERRELGLTSCIWTFGFYFFHGVDIILMAPLTNSTTSQWPWTIG